MLGVTLGTDFGLQGKVWSWAGALALGAVTRRSVPFGCNRQVLRTGSNLTCTDSSYTNSRSKGELRILHMRSFSKDFLQIPLFWGQWHKTRLDLRGFNVCQQASLPWVEGETIQIQAEHHLRGSTPPRTIVPRCDAAMNGTKLALNFLPWGSLSQHSVATGNLLRNPTKTLHFTHWVPGRRAGTCQAIARTRSALTEKCRSEFVFPVNLSLPHSLHQAPKTQQSSSKHSQLFSVQNTALLLGQGSIWWQFPIENSHKKEEFIFYQARQVLNVASQILHNRWDLARINW